MEVVMLSDALHETYTHARWALLLRGLIALAVGILIFTRPLQSTAAFALVIAIWALVSGITQFVDAIEARKIVPHWWLLLLGGLVSIAFGVAALYYYPALSLAFAVIWAAWWLLLSGFVGIYIAMQERKMQTSWGWTLTFSILSVVAGIYAIVTPGVTLAAIMGLIAGFAIVGGIVLLIGFFKLGSIKSQAAAAAAPARS
jgi:uncharacterized membrane protein HdeD (DUF308 family)